MKKKIIVIIAAILLIVMTTAVCVKFYNDSRTLKITDFYDNDANTIQSITIRKFGKDELVVPRNDYENVMEFLAKMSFPGVHKGSKIDGWSYEIVIKTSKESISIVPLGTKCIINEKYYNLEGCDEKFLKELYEKLSKQ